MQAERKAMNITTNELLALGAVLATVAGCVHRVCLAIERAFPASKAAGVAAKIDSAVAVVEAVTGKGGAS
jgi:hypothetical protein